MVDLEKETNNEVIVAQNMDKEPTQEDMGPTVNYMQNRGDDRGTMIHDVEAPNHDISPAVGVAGNNQSNWNQEDDSDSNVSEYVDSTQYHLQDKEAADDINDMINVNLVQKDMAFLKQSWVNMSEQEATNALEMQVDEQIERENKQLEEHHNEGFQLVTSRAHKKKMQKIQAATRSNFSTRSQSGKSNPSL